MNEIKKSELDISLFVLFASVDDVESDNLTKKGEVEGERPYKARMLFFYR